MTVTANIIRLVAIGLYCTVMVGVVKIVLTYYQIWLREKQNWIGLLPRHVCLIGISYIAYATDSVALTLQKWGEPLGPLTVTNVLAGAIGVFAIRAMNAYQAKRMVP